MNISTGCKKSHTHTHTHSLDLSMRSPENSVHLSFCEVLLKVFLVSLSLSLSLSFGCFFVCAIAGSTYESYIFYHEYAKCILWPIIHANQCTLDKFEWHKNEQNKSMHKIVDLPEIKGNHRKFRTLVTSYIGNRIQSIYQ